MTDTLASGLAAHGFAFVPADGMGALLDETAPGWRADWADVAASWDDLGPDLYMADGGRYRRRRHAVFAADAAGIARKAHQPHYQSRDFNSLNGGIARWFNPVTEAVAASAALGAIVAAAQAVFERASRAMEARPIPPSWHVELHQFRIEASPGAPGKPTPEGMHRDGVDWVLVLLVGRENVASGETTISADGSTMLDRFTLARPLDAALVDDHRLFHGVTPITPLDPSRPAWRDVLVVTFRHA